MKSEEDPQIWLHLREAFNRVGLALFNINWIQRSAHLSPGRYRSLVEAVMFRPSYEIEHLNPDHVEEEIRWAWDDYEIATRDEVIQYDCVRQRIFEHAWNGKINVRLITQDGKIEIPPRKVWKSKTDEWEISIPDSEIGYRHDNDGRVYSDIELLELDINSLVTEIDKERKKAVRLEAARMNPNKGGAPLKYDWPSIDVYITDELRDSTKSTSDSEIKRRVSKRLEAVGIDPPVSSQMRARIADIRKG